MKPQRVIITTRTERILTAVLVGSVLMIAALIGVAFFYEWLRLRWPW